MASEEIRVQIAVEVENQARVDELTEELENLEKKRLIALSFDQESVERWEDDIAGVNAELEKLTGVSATASTSTDDLTTSTEDSGAVMGEAGAIAVDLASDLGFVDDKTVQLVNSLRRTEGATKATSKAMGAMSRASGALIGGLAFLGAALAGAALAYKEWKDVQDARNAFNSDEVDRFASAIREAGDNIDGLMAAFDAGGVQLQLFDDAGIDVTAMLGQMGLTAEQTAALVAGGSDTVDDWEQAMRDAGISGKNLDLTVLALNQAVDNNADAVEAANAQMAFFEEGAVGTTVEVDGLSNAILALDGNLKVNVSSLGAHFDKIAEFKRIAEANEQAAKDWLNELSQEGAWNDLQDAFADLNATSVAVMETAKGDAEEHAQALDDSKEAVFNLEGEILNYLALIEDIPEDVVTDIKALIDEEAYEEALRKLASLERVREVILQVKVAAPSDYVPSSGYTPGLPDGGGSTVNNSTTNVTINVPRTSNAAEVTGELDRWGEINGAE